MVNRAPIETPSPAGINLFLPWPIQAKWAIEQRLEHGIPHKKKYDSLQKSDWINIKVWNKNAVAPLIL